MKDNEKVLEKNLLDVVRQKEESDKRLLAMEIICGVLCLIPLLFSIILVEVILMEEWKAALIILASLLPLLVVTPFMLKIEQIAGYYECEKCSYRYIPNYTSVFMAAHVGRTRRMKCPKCGEKSWQKKVISKEK